MFLSKTALFLCCAEVLLLVVVADKDLERTKRQAPSINVHRIPKTGFSCNNRKVGEYYADPETNCQVYHVCVPGMHSKMSLISFVCPNGTIFSQATRVCTPYERVDCSLTTQFYETLHGDANSRRTDYENENDFNFVPQPPARETTQPPRQAPRSRNTPPPTSPPRDIPTQPQRNAPRFRNQFRGPQTSQTTTSAPTRTPTTVPRVSPVRPAPPAFRPPAPVRPVVSNIVPPRVTPRPVVSTSTASYNYEYEYEYDYEDETPTADQANSRNKRDVTLEQDLESTTEDNSEKKSFNCEDKVAGGVYADIESNCQFFHICVPMGKHNMLDYKVVCADGTAFDQETGSCREEENVKCDKAHLFYQLEKRNRSGPIKKAIFKKKNRKSAVNKE